MDSDRITQTAYLQRIVPALMEWFPSHRRILPWRENPLPYYVWVSEIMLQQTRVETVKPYFSRFVSELPSVRALAVCPEEKLLKLWEGLGYYSRVRNMQKAARIMTEVYGGSVPPEAEELVRLPGIGSYTAAAVSSIAYGRCEAAVDGNVLRVVSRVCADSSCTDEPNVKKRWESVLRNVMRSWQQSHPAEPERPQGTLAGEIVSGSGLREPEKPLSNGNFPGTFNQAMMEIGATVCVPNGLPACGDCPLENLCLAHQEGREQAFPVRRAKKDRRREIRTVLVITDGEKTVLHRRDRKGLLAGLWELPNCEGPLKAEDVLSKVRDMGLSPLRVMPLPSARHIFTHLEWDMSGYLVLVEPAEYGNGQQADRTGSAVSTRNSKDAEEEPDRVLRDADGREYLLTAAEKARDVYAVPSAFSAYMRYLGETPCTPAEETPEEGKSRKG